MGLGISKSFQILSFIDWQVTLIQVVAQSSLFCLRSEQDMKDGSQNRSSSKYNERQGEPVAGALMIE